MVFTDKWGGGFGQIADEWLDKPKGGTFPSDLGFLIGFDPDQEGPPTAIEEANLLEMIEKLGPLLPGDLGMKFRNKPSAVKKILQKLEDNPEEIDPATMAAIARELSTTDDQGNFRYGGDSLISTTLSPKIEKMNLNKYSDVFDPESGAQIQYGQKRLYDLYERTKIKKALKPATELFNEQMNEVQGAFTRGDINFPDAQKAMNEIKKVYTDARSAITGGIETAGASAPKGDKGDVPPSIGDFQERKKRLGKQYTDSQAREEIALGNLDLRLKEATRRIEETGDYITKIEDEEVKRKEDIAALEFLQRADRQVWTDNMDATYDLIRTQKLDPNRFYQNTWQVVGAALASAVGTYAQTRAAFAGASIPNTAAKLIESAIERDVQAQIKNYEMLQGSANLEQNMYARAMSEQSNEMQAKIVASNAGRELAKQKLTTLMNMSTNATNNAEAQRLVATLENTKQKNLEAAQSKIDTNIAANIKAMRSGKAKQGDRSLQIDQLERMGKFTLEAWQNMKKTGNFTSNAVSFLTSVGVSDARARSMMQFDWFEGSLNTQLYYIQSTMYAKMITNFTDGARPTDKDMLVLISFMPLGGTLGAGSVSGEKTLKFITNMFRQLNESGKDLGNSETGGGLYNMIKNSGKFKDIIKSVDARRDAFWKDAGPLGGFELGQSLNTMIIRTSN